MATVGEPTVSRSRGWAMFLTVVDRRADRNTAVDVALV
jgi:hypothetical protein